MKINSFLLCLLLTLVLSSTGQTEEPVGATLSLRSYDLNPA